MRLSVTPRDVPDDFEIIEDQRIVRRRDDPSQTWTFEAWNVMQANGTHDSDNRGEDVAQFELSESQGPVSGRTRSSRTRRRRTEIPTSSTSSTPSRSKRPRKTTNRDEELRRMKAMEDSIAELRGMMSQLIRKQSSSNHREEPVRVAKDLRELGTIIV